MSHETLQLTFHGRIIDQFGNQMYQSPVAAIAEMVSNAWDADAEEVYITLPVELGDEAEIVIADTGTGMTFNECQDRYLNVGWCRREEESGQQTPEKGRPVLGRKGIGKFSGFGIAEMMQIETTSKQNGERTVFVLDHSSLCTDNYLEPSVGLIPVVEHLQPDEDLKSRHGTIIRLKHLNLGRAISSIAFARSMARRFTLHQRVGDFKVYVNGDPLPESDDLERVEFAFPRDYNSTGVPAGVRFESVGDEENRDWGFERLRNGREIKWRVLFYREPIEEEEMRGIAIFSRGKLAQKPFFFNLSGGLGGQHGLEYMSGQIEADYVDDLQEDIIAPERQRINWDHHETVDFENWGQQKIIELLRIWHDKRGERRRREIEEKVAGFAQRLDKLPGHEKRTVKKALMKLGSIPTLSDEQFQSLGGAILQAWEQGRLHNLIDELSVCDDITPNWLLDLLVEADVLVALNLAEAVKTKLEAIKGLRALVEKGELENAVRDYIAEKPYLLNPKWETFKVEISVKHILDEAAGEAKLTEDEYEGERKRVDLALRSGEHLLIVEFMQPGKSLDWDHITRCKRYVHLIRNKVRLLTELGIEKVTGLIVADRLEKRPDVLQEIIDLSNNGVYAYDWETLLSQSERTWREYLDILGGRAPEDERIRNIKTIGMEEEASG